ncbi:GNAT family N-acetyltransferase [Clostridium beijerinckii]|uniref:GNAT family N-acetyltransferase n=1 Tax=Clostridium beijerinckii TaxID=1520 RepID=UPI0014943330|nr:GNAT family protein [Clostridium beijerinckii]NOW05378.1 ribosomal-protein-alanine N-acetyltransferase [Clostridium beijerinckii]NYC01480.1 ribosomal-protein-alanine N-acetyltransferase [Clostridium beijerinckii]
MTDNIVFKKIDDDFAIQLLEILNNDEKLQAELGTNDHNISKEEFINHNNKWATSTNSEIFTIVLNGRAIGTISLSHQNLKESKAQVGYWIGSYYWKNGYTSKVFSKILDYAKRKGIKYLSAKINEENIASKRIWEKYNANIKIVDNRFYANIILADINGKG